jgi:hypothetical protein
MPTHEYKIAVLLPTRGRTDALDRSLLGLLEKANDLDSIQLMLGLDSDDSVGVEHFQKELQPKLDDMGINYTAMLFTPMGYGRLNEYINELAKNSSADWLFFWNDDAIMETQDWDDRITEHTGEFKLLAVHTHNDHPYSIFPIVPAGWLDIIGHLSLHSMTDAWLSQVAYLIDIWERIDVNVLHDRADLTGNNKDSTFKNRELLEGNPHNPRDFHNPALNSVRMGECEKLDAYLHSIGQGKDWWSRVKVGEQDPWEHLRINDINKQMVQFQLRRT